MEIVIKTSEIRRGENGIISIPTEITRDKKTIRIYIMNIGCLKNLFDIINKEIEKSESKIVIKLSIENSELLKRLSIKQPKTKDIMKKRM